MTITPKNNLDRIDKSDRLVKDYLTDESLVDFSGAIPRATFPETPAIKANSYYFSQPEWAKTYFESCHRDETFKARWQATVGSWTDKIVVDLGCGPGNLYATLEGQPKLLIGVDVAPGSLEMAKALGYLPLLADAHDLPLISGFADLVTVNATLHHCENMPQVLQEAARLVRPGGILVIDHDPQLSAWNYRGIGLWLYKIRLSVLYRWFLTNLYIPEAERFSALATETHHKPGHGVTPELFRNTLEPMGFSVQLFPHNNAIGAEVLQGLMGKPPHWRYRLGQFLSGMNPYSKESALSLMCLATKS